MLRSHLILIGMRGSGKTSIGRLVADRIQVRFADLDDATLESFAETSVREVWQRHGEAAWRAAEVRALDEWLRGRPRVLALGGGTPLISEARTRLTQARAQGVCALIYLFAPAEVLRERLKDACGDRPSLTGADPLQELADVLAARDATYRELANLVMNTSELSLEGAADRIVEYVAKRR